MGLDAQAPARVCEAERDGRAGVLGDGRTVAGLDKPVTEREILERLRTRRNCRAPPGRKGRAFGPAYGGR